MSEKDKLPERFKNIHALLALDLKKEEFATSFKGRMAKRMQFLLDASKTKAFFM